MPSTKGKVCSNCGNRVEVVRSAIKNGKFYENMCERCLANYKHIADYARKYDRDRGREDYRKDIIQRWDGDKPSREFIEAYPEEAEEYFGPENMRDYGVKRKQY